MEIFVFVVLFAVLFAGTVFLLKAIERITYRQEYRKRYGDAMAEIPGEEGQEPQYVPVYYKEPRPRKKSWAPLIVALVIVAVFAFTNPSTADFKSSGAWFNGVYTLYQDGELTLIEYGLYSAPGILDVNPINRYNWLVFSTYNVGGIKFVGVFNMIFVNSGGSWKRVK